MGFLFGHRRAKQESLRNVSLSRPAAPATRACVEQLEPRALFAGNGLSAAYFDDTNLSILKYGKTDTRVMFDWNSAPLSGFGNDFSARWIGRVQARYSEQYRFVTLGTGGVRVWVNNQLITDDWSTHALKSDSGYATLAAGQRADVRIEYFDTRADGSFRLYWQSAHQAKEVIPQKYLYSNAPESKAPSAPTGLKGTYASDTALSFKWNPVTDASGFVLYDVYIGKTKVATTTETSYARGSRSPETNYGFTVKAVDAFGNAAYSNTLTMTTTKAVAPSHGTGLAASYYTGDEFGQYTMTRTDPQVNFAWGSPPVDGSEGDYSVRWKGKIIPKYGELYTFYATASGGVRVWIDNKLVIDHWQEHLAGMDTYRAHLTAGQKYDVRVDYHNAGSASNMTLEWSSLSQARQVIPASQMMPAFVDALAPSKPTNLAVSAVTRSSVSFSWNASTDDVGVAGYDIYRNGQKIDRVSDTNYTDSGLSSNTQYTYAVAAVDGAGRASSQASVTAKTAANPANRDGLTVIAANSYDSSNGVGSSGSNVASLDNGDWLQYAGVDFHGGVNSVKLVLGCPTGSEGGSFELRVDSLNGPVIGTLVVQPTGSYNTYYTQQTEVSGVSGIHDLFIVARNRSSIANLQSFQFSTKSLVKIMPLGDSITHGFVADSTWRYYLYQQLRNAGYGVDFVGSQHTLTDGYDPHLDYDQDHEGHSGWRADQVLGQINGWANATHPDVVLIHLGTNDLRAGQSPQSTINEISQIIDVLRSVNSHVKIVLAQIIPAGDAPAGSVQAFNNLIPGLASSKNTSASPVETVDQYTGFNLGTDSDDNLHPNNQGDQKMAGKWFDALQSLLS
jgi:lysophospholipase L1-like esterase/chitodextrinase